MFEIDTTVVSNQSANTRSNDQVCAVFEGLLGGVGHYLGPPQKKEPSPLTVVSFGVPVAEVLIRTEAKGRFRWLH